MCAGGGRETRRGDVTVMDMGDRIVELASNFGRGFFSSRRANGLHLSLCSGLSLDVEGKMACNLYATVFAIKQTTPQ